jgi:hypothetical protein
VKTAISEFHLLTERDESILISVTKGGHMGKPTDLVQGTLDLLILTLLGRKELEKEAANWDRLSTAISRVVRLKEA